MGIGAIARRELSRQARDVWALLGLPFVVAVVVALGVRLSLLVLPLGLAAAALVVVALWRTRQVQGRRSTVQPAATRLPARFRWLPVAWVAFTFVSTQKLSQRSVDAASNGQASFENVVEVAFYALIAGVLVLNWLPKPTWAPRTRSALLLGWPLFAVFSTAWSLIPQYTVVRALQMLVIVAFAVFSARVLDSINDDGTALARPFFRIFINLCTCLALFAFAYPYEIPDPTVPGVPVDPSVAVVSSLHGRLAWYGVHPLVAAEILGTATLALAVIGPRFLRLSFPGWAVRLAILGAATARTQGRSIILGLALALVVALWVRGRSRPLQRYLGVGYYLALCAAGVVIFHQQLFDAATRGEGTQRLLNLNGRLPLWQLSLHELRTVKEIFVGFGLGASRALLPQDVSFAGQSHNSVIEALLGAGLLGLLLMLGWLWSLGWSLRASRFLRPLPRPVQAALSAVFGLLLVLGLISPELAGPGYSYSLLGFIAVFALRTTPAQAPGVALGSPHRSSEERAAPALAVSP